MSNEPLTPLQKKRLALNWLIFLSIVAVVVCYFVQRDRRYKVQDEFVRSSVQVAPYQFHQNPIDSISIKYDSTHISNAKAIK